MDPPLYGHGYAQICICMTYIYIVCLVAMSKSESSSHGSMLYSSIHACLFHSWIYLVLVCSYEFGYLHLRVNILMYYRCLLGCILRTSQHFHLVPMTCSQSSRLSYPSKTHALGGILLYQNPITIM